MWSGAFFKAWTSVSREPFRRSRSSTVRKATADAIVKSTADTMWPNENDLAASDPRGGTTSTGAGAARLRVPTMRVWRRHRGVP